MLRDYASAISLLTRTLDILLVAVAGWLAYALRFFDQPSPPLPMAYSALTLIGALLVLIIFPLFSVYDSWRAKGMFAPAGRALMGWFVVYLSGLVILVVVRESTLFSRLWLAYWGLLSAMLLVGLRIAIYWLLRSLRRRGYNRRPVVIVGADQQGRALAARARSADWSGLEVLALFDVPASVQDADDGLAVYPLDALASFVTEHQVGEVWVAMPLERGAELRQVIELLRHSPVNIRYAPDLFGLSLLNNGVTEIVGVPMIDLSASPMQGVNRLLKALEDRLLAALILLSVSPLMLLIAVAIKLSSPGPILFRQRRHGWDGQEIVIYKFRTMRVHAEAGRVTQATRRDPRVTALGALLRGTSLDELPQFVNVLQGRMSIVGPRPHAVEHNAQYCDMIDRYMLRHKVKPGITGWAQINGWRGETDTVEKMQQRVEHDLYYIEHWSLGFDLKIIFMTLLRGFVHRNAY
ncbi:undecaprenyl-phosphate glucose phosphotransferase [Acidihalobacter yilgarnensis]|uniref:undecaprenyl-phosphate glucose phosphotransferase n=1 Tax=Acidihalobacter yilgarnensis TaxID=2819280 RepID=UPI001E3E8049|nr:undecaprenyl-phosphate glucose phosphotransferase [Acidihalobacter yilgarnensis]